MANEEVRIKFKADTQDAMKRLSDIGKEIDSINDKKGEGEMISKQDMDNIHTLAKEVDGLGRVLKYEADNVAKKLIGAQKALNNAINKSMDENVVKAIERNVKLLEQKQKDIQKTLSSYGMGGGTPTTGGGSSSGGGSGFDWKGAMSNVGQGVFQGMLQKGSLAGGLSGGLSALSKFAPQLAILGTVTAGISKLVSMTKEGEQQYKQLSKTSAQMSQAGGYGSDKLVESALHRSKYFSTLEESQYAQSYLSQVGSNGGNISKMKDDMSYLLNNSLALGVDTNNLIGGYSQTQRMGAKSMNADEYSNLIQNVAVTSGAEGRQDEIINSLEQITENTYKTQLRLSEDQIEEIGKGTAQFSDILDVDYEKGAEIYSKVNSAFTGSQNYNAILQAIMTQQGGSGLDGKIEAQKQAEKGLTQENLNAVFDEMDKYQSYSAKNQYLQDVFGLTATEADEFITKEDKFRTYSDKELNDEISKKRKDYLETTDATNRTIDANVADISLTLGSFYKDFKNVVLKDILGADDYDKYIQQQEDEAKADIADQKAKEEEAKTKDENATKEEKEKAKKKQKEYEEDKEKLKDKSINSTTNTRLRYQVGLDGEREKEALRKKYGEDIEEVDGSHAVGAGYIPHDNYKALLHEGEAVLTKTEAEALRSKGMMTNKNTDEKLNLTERRNVIDLMRQNLDQEDTVLEKRKTIDENFSKLLTEWTNGKIEIQSKSDNTASGGTGSVTSDGNIGDTSTYGVNYDLNGLSQSGQDPTHGLSEAQVNAYLNSKAKKGGTMYNQGKAFLQASKESGLDIYYLIAHAATETGWGGSNITTDKSNMYGIGAFDNSPYASAYSFDNSSAGIIEGAKWIAKNYTNGKYNQDTLYKMSNNPQGHNYATDPNWSNTIATIMQSTASALGSGTVNNNQSYNITVNEAKTGSAQVTAEVVAKKLQQLDLSYSYKRV